MTENIGKFCETFNNVDESIIFQVFPMLKILSMIRNQPNPIFSFRRLLVSEGDWQVHTSVLFDHSLSGAREGIADSRKYSCSGSYTTLNMISALFTICMKYSKCAIPLRASVSLSGYKRPSITCGYFFRCMMTCYGIIERGNWGVCHRLRWRVSDREKFWWHPQCSNRPQGSMIKSIWRTWDISAWRKNDSENSRAAFISEESLYGNERRLLLGGPKAWNHSQYKNLERSRFLFKGRSFWQPESSKDGRLYTNV